MQPAGVARASVVVARAGLLVQRLLLVQGCLYSVGAARAALLWGPSENFPVGFKNSSVLCTHSLEAQNQKWLFQKNFSK